MLQLPSVFSFHSASLYFASSMSCALSPGITHTPSHSEHDDGMEHAPLVTTMMAIRCK